MFHFNHLRSKWAKLENSFTQMVTKTHKLIPNSTLLWHKFNAKAHSAARSFVSITSGRVVIKNLGNRSDWICIADSWQEGCNLPNKWLFWLDGRKMWVFLGVFPAQWPGSLWAQWGSDGIFKIYPPVALHNIISNKHRVSQLL